MRDLGALLRIEIIALVLVLIIPSVASLSHRSQDDDSPYAAYPNGNQSKAEVPQGPPAVGDKQTDSRTQKQPDGQRDGHPRPTWSIESLVAFFERYERFFVSAGTPIIALLTGALAVSTYFLWSATTRLVRDAEDGRKATQRAFVYIESFDARRLGVEFHIYPKWTNTGSTPTKWMRNYVNWLPYFFEPTQYPDLDASGTPLADQPGPGIEFFVGPNSSTYGQAVKIPLEYVNAIAAGYIRAFVWGWARYADWFNGTPVHVLEFCHEVVVVPFVDETGGHQYAISFRMYGPHNRVHDE